LTSKPNGCGDDSSAFVPLLAAKSMSGLTSQEQVRITGYRSSVLELAVEGYEHGYETASQV